MSWLSYEQVQETYGHEPAELRQMVREGKVITKREDCIQLFDSDGLGEPLVATDQAVEVTQVGEDHPETDIAQEAADDFVERTAVVVEDALVGWLSYSDLASRHSIKRGWLDGLVNTKKVRYERQYGQQVFNMGDVLECLKQDPDQQKAIRRLWR